eukprot:9305863-Pyramimonas_sp.AAC.1
MRPSSAISSGVWLISCCMKLCGLASLPSAWTASSVASFSTTLAAMSLILSSSSRSHALCFLTSAATAVKRLLAIRSASAASASLSGLDFCLGGGS